ncbi:hypothetical protein A3I27_00195 [Candidatus Giovannonibacteria bacterium RIFCSPLOWO2_02_FULL_43_11b]|uniref:Uncharacterized protein n=1 Tax=Candidatus Giovannonibacteria bacterium RIFCSPHIGHO2_12_FULL_43_15 TaxID=1798341 RepID=A0A1F5WQP7_9BACT|nr:MAG: hypothetical protein A2739_02220 [Candidatus Giovannonibacteria bacterium RIFCSPHIGHO2_01_FULL_43_100]OGF67002.1 MAG: hypothetical protein A3B97_00175 [Candidatus Giovannonibacteria bacterium RIFCSPHIGHO2_02_FULL_43_32]OGF77924.1 MAG: hypothetical protein A3F23_04300 [Candidatus Giovannonibacteria bacterium RIFCSPHIGHO2_12_FULL_43_15]OGF78699.1 MAG: hypothetical protein A3A15_01975 [Candidatus Giovannonibacteria bacterium RIFCSPLOWO2_01_FULL_43_60]OGF89402.1 MAG: hypothetical protein A3
MPSKTPKFDAALDAILENLKPHTRKCKQCAGDFEIFKEDIEFYHKLHVPPPQNCPDCRKQQRLAFSNNTIFYVRSCDVSGHKERLISLFPTGINWKVYDNHYWWSEDWDPMSFGSNYDLGKSFFNQFHVFNRKLPLTQSNRDPKSIGSEYTAYGVELKDCYYVFGGTRSENILYGNWPIFARDSIDVLIAFQSELCYEIVSSFGNYNCNFIYFSDNCLDSLFLYDCKNCTHCFGGVNLRNKQYYFFNEPYTKEEYEKKMSEINLGSRKEFLCWYKKYFDFLNDKIKRATRNEKTVNSIGTFLRNSKNCFMCFWAEGENLRYVDYATALKDSMDTSIAGGNMQTQNELLYQSSYSGTYNIKCSSLVRSSHDVEYSMNCINLENCFGCVGLRNKKYCIFNKQYMEEEYWKTLDEIKSKMLADGEYGEFFPISMSPYPYNASLAQFEFPLTKEGVEKIGGYWAESVVSLEGIDPKNILKGDQIPDDIKNVGDDILDKVFICEVTGKPFRIIKQELEFYRRKNLPLPTKHPYQRIMERWAMKEPFKLWKYPCSNCGQEMHTSYNPAKKLKVYCESCYLKEVI